MRAVLTAAACLWASAASAEVVIHTSYASWSAAVGGQDAKIDFNLGVTQPLAEQYASLGVHFTSSSGLAVPSSFAGDGWAAKTLFPTFGMEVNYDAPQFGLGFDLINLFKVSLYWQGGVVYESPQLNEFGGVFRGISIDTPFDRAVMQAIPGDAGGRIDNLYVANPIPSPAVGAAALGLLMTARGRRRRG